MRYVWLLLLTMGLADIGSAFAAGVLRRGAFGEPESLQPNQSGVASEQVILRDLFEGLTTFDPAGTVIPGVAESWTVSADGLRYRFKLRPALRWSDGAALKAADFVYAFRRTLTPSTTAARASRLFVLRNAVAVHDGTLPPAQLGVSAPDDRTVLIELEHPLPSLPLLLAGEEGYPLPQQVVDRAGATWTRPGTMVSNGAFVLAERRPRGVVRLTRNRNFHEATGVSLDQVDYLPSDDTVSLVNRFRAGELEINGWPGFAAARQAPLRQELGNAVHVTPLVSVRYLRFNIRRPPFDDVRVREALSLAVDRDLLVARVMPGGERASFRVVPAGLSDDQPPRDNPLQNGNAAARLARARALLAQTAWHSPGRPLRLRAPSGNGEQLCLAVIAMWKLAGVNVVLEQSEIKSMIADMRKGDFDIALTGAQDVPSYEAYLERFRRGAYNNTGGYANSTFDAALDRAGMRVDSKQRAAALAQAEAILIADHAIVPLIQEVARSLVAPRVLGWVDNPYDIHLSRWLGVK